MWSLGPFHGKNLQNIINIFALQWVIIGKIRKKIIFWFFVNYGAKSKHPRVFFFNIWSRLGDLIFCGVTQGSRSNLLKYFNFFIFIRTFLIIICKTAVPRKSSPIFFFNLISYLNLKLSVFFITLVPRIDTLKRLLNFSLNKEFSDLVF